MSICLYNCLFCLYQAGLPYTPEYDAKITEYLRKSKESRTKLASNPLVPSPRHSPRSPRTESLHEYHLEDYGLSVDIINARFSQYIKTFKLDTKE